MASNPPQLRSTSAPSNTLRIILGLALIMAVVWSGFSAFGFLNLMNGFIRDPLVRIAYLVLAILQILITLIEFFGFVTCCLGKARLVKFYCISSLFAILLVAGSGTITLLLHHRMKSTIIDSCIASGPALDYCTNLYNIATRIDIILLICPILIAIAFTFLSWTYLRQLKRSGPLKTSDISAPSPYVFPLVTYPNSNPYGQEQGPGGYSPTYLKHQQELFNNGTTTTNSTEYYHPEMKFDEDAHYYEDDKKQGHKRLGSGYAV